MKKFSIGTKDFDVFGGSYLGEQLNNFLKEQKLSPVKLKELCDSLEKYAYSEFFRKVEEIGYNVKEDPYLYPKIQQMMEKGIWNEDPSRTTENIFKKAPENEQPIEIEEKRDIEEALSDTTSSSTEVLSHIDTDDMEDDQDIETNIESASQKGSVIAEEILENETPDEAAGGSDREAQNVTEDSFRQDDDRFLDNFLQELGPTQIPNIEDWQNIDTSAQRVPQGQEAIDNLNAFEFDPSILESFYPYQADITDSDEMVDLDIAPTGEYAPFI